MSLVLRLPREIYLCRSSSHVPRLPIFLGNATKPSLWQGEEPLASTTQTTLQRPKVARTCGVLYMLTSKCASRHNCVHFFDISTFKSGPELVCFAHFDLETCFAPQRRALFRHLNFKKWSENGVFCIVLYILTSKCASRHNGVHFLDISTSKSGPRMFYSRGPQLLALGERLTNPLRHTAFCSVLKRTQA